MNDQTALEHLDVLLTVGSLVVLALLCAVAVLAHEFDDTLVQRMALASCSIGALSLAAWCMRAGDVPVGLAVMALATAAYAAETARKVWMRVRRGTFLPRDER